MTPNQHRARWLVIDPDTGTLTAPELAAVVDLHRLTADQIDAATDASELDAIPADVLAESVSLAALLADGLRWRAWMATPYNVDATRGDSWQAPATIPCASCRLAGDGYTAVDVRAAVVVPWDVMGDPRAYAMVCPECAAPDTPTATPNPAHVCDTCGTETPHATWHYSFTATGQPENARTYCGPCWAESVKVTPNPANTTDVIPLSVTHMLLDAVEDGDLDAVADIVAVHGYDENAEGVGA